MEYRIIRIGKWYIVKRRKFIFWHYEKINNVAIATKDYYSAVAYILNKEAGENKHD